MGIYLCNTCISFTVKVGLTHLKGAWVNGCFLLIFWTFHWFTSSSLCLFGLVANDTVAICFTKFTNSCQKRASGSTATKALSRTETAMTTVHVCYHIFLNLNFFKPEESDWVGQLLWLHHIRTYHNRFFLAPFGFSVSWTWRLSPAFPETDADGKSTEAVEVTFRPEEMFVLLATAHGCETDLQGTI